MKEIAFFKQFTNTGHVETYYYIVPASLQGAVKADGFRIQTVSSVPKHERENARQNGQEWASS